MGFSKSISKHTVICSPTFNQKHAIKRYISPISKRHASEKYFENVLKSKEVNIPIEICFQKCSATQAKILLHSTAETGQQSHFYDTRINPASTGTKK